MKDFIYLYKLGGFKNLKENGFLFVYFNKHNHKTFLDNSSADQILDFLFKDDLSFTKEGSIFFYKDFDKPSKYFNFLYKQTKCSITNPDQIVIESIKNIEQYLKIMNINFLKNKYRKQIEKINSDAIPYIYNIFDEEKYFEVISWVLKNSNRICLYQHCIDPVYGFTPMIFTNSEKEFIQKLRIFLSEINFDIKELDDLGDIPIW